MFSLPRWLAIQPVQFSGVIRLVENPAGQYLLYDGANIVQATVTDPLNHVESMAYGTNGYFTSGNILTDTKASGTAVAQTSSYSWDLSTQLLLSTTDALGRTTSYTYDALGNRTGVTYLANTSQAVTATAVYDPTFSNLTSITDPLQHTTTLAYDSKGNLTSITNPLQQTTTFSHNSAGQLTSVTLPAPAGTAQLNYTGPDLTSMTDPLGDTARLTADGVGRMISRTSPVGQTTSYQYDTLDQLVQLQDAIGGTTGFAYDPNGNLLSVTDALQHATNYTYDARNRRIMRTDSLQHSENSGYDLDGNLATFTDRRGQATAYTYDALNRIQHIQYADSSTITYTYDVGNRVIQIVDSNSGTITRQYDGLDRLIQEQTPQGTVSYTYDAAGRRTSMTVSGQANPVVYTYDNANRLTQVIQGSNTVSIAYDSAGRRATLTLPNGIVATYTYDVANQLTGITYTNSSTVIGNLTYTYDANGNRIQVDGTLASTGLPTAVAAATYNEDNQLQQWGTSAFSYDLNGNLVSDGTNNYAWDARNQLASITGSVFVTPQYDAFGRRILNPAGQYLLYDGANIVQEQNNGAVTVNLLTGLGIDEHFLWSDSTGDHSYLTDALNSTIALANSSANLTAQYSYDPFGSTTIAGNTSNNLAYTGRENDGTGLYYYRARYYDPTFGRFISENPKGFNGGDANLYAYAFTSPTNLFDPTGLDAWTSVGGAFRAFGGLGEAAAGVGLGAATSWTGIGALAGGAVALHGLDQVQAGVRQLFSGCHVNSFTSQGLQGIGLSSSVANLLDAGISVAGSLGAGTAAQAINAGGVATIFYYEAGQSTMSASEFAQYGQIDNAVERGMQRVADQGWVGALLSGFSAPSQFGYTIPQGLTPLARGGLGALGGAANGLTGRGCGCGN